MSDSRNSSADRKTARHKVKRRGRVSDWDDENEVRASKINKSKKKTRRQSKRLIDLVDVADIDDLVLEVEE
ncbi:MAG: hypothetical protein KKA42_09230 [candidate division Zixibacteria bacterium]|nr:hypothetical protein [candidate division Zixibacteria bacterium]